MKKVDLKQRTKNSARNVIVGIVLNVLTILVGLVTQRIFLRILNTEYLGLNSLFSNILTMLSVAELGITNAVIFSMYKPLAEGDQKTIRALLRFYRKWYTVIGCIILVLGLIILPFVPAIVGEQSLDINLYVIYAISLADIVLSYYLGYKRSIIIAAQQNYILDLVQIGYILSLSVFQMLALFLTKNYYIYLIVRLTLRVLQNVGIIIIANKKFPYITKPNPPELDEKMQKSIFKKIKGLVYHKIGGFIVLGTDNIIITTFLGLAVNGLYASYYLIISALQTIIMQCITVTTASVGNLLVKSDIKKQFEVFRRIRFINFCLATVGSAGLLTVMSNFIEIWLGPEYVLGMSVLAALTLNFYFYVMRPSLAVFKEAAGIFHEDRFIPIIESVLNIVVSIVLVKLIGLPGVFIGTFVSGLALYCFSYPKFVYHGIFKRSYRSYAFETIGYSLAAGIICCVTFYIAKGFSHMMWLEGIGVLISNIIISIVVPTIIILAVFANSDEMKYCRDLLKHFIKRGK